MDEDSSSVIDAFEHKTEIKLATGIALCLFSTLPPSLT